MNKTEKCVVSLLIEDTEYTAEELAAKIGVFIFEFAVVNHKCLRGFGYFPTSYFMKLE